MIEKPTSATITFNQLAYDNASLIIEVDSSNLTNGSSAITLKDGDGKGLTDTSDISNVTKAINSGKITAMWDQREGAYITITTLNMTKLAAATVPASGAKTLTDGLSKIYLQIPGNLQVSSSPAGIDCISNVASSQVRFEKYQGPVLTIDEAGGCNLLQQTTARVPEGAKNVAALPTQYNPLPLFGWTDLEVVLRYEFVGQIMRRSVMYMHMLPGREVVFSVVAPDADFNKVCKQSRSILTSWFEPSRDLPPDLASKYEAGGG